MAKDDVVVVGLGEVGRPLFELISGKLPAIGIDIEPTFTPSECAILHICYPFGDAFIRTVVQYIRRHRPALTIINSTVAPGTTRTIQRQVLTPVVYSPIRGKHVNMKEDLLRYTKFIGGIDADASQLAQTHFETLGLKTRIVSSPETAELTKLTETTYFGLLIAWAQEVERYCATVHANYDEVAAFYEEIGFLPPVKYTPGVIGGHCVMPNIQILLRSFKSDFLDCIVKSNERKIAEMDAVPSAVNS